MTPEEFRDRMQAIALEDDMEKAHKQGDNLVVELLKSIGYQNGAVIYEHESAMKWWYS